MEEAAMSTDSSNMVSSALHLPTITAPKTSTKRCLVCHKRTSLATSFQCRWFKIDRFCFYYYLQILCCSCVITHARTHTRLTALCPVLPRWAGTRKVKLIWILLKHETVSGSGISWVICKSAPRSRHVTKPAPHHSGFYRPDALPAAQPTTSEHWRPQLYHKRVGKCITETHCCHIFFDFVS